VTPAFHACLLTFCLLVLIALPALFVYCRLAAKLEEMERRMDEEGDDE
jgi:hypothetical protein